MDVTLSYVIYRVIIGTVICILFGILQHRYPHYNILYILIGFFIGGGIFCLIFSDEILYILITIYFISSTAVVAAIRLIQIIKEYRSQQSKKNNML